MIVKILHLIRKAELLIRYARLIVIIKMNFKIALVLVGLAEA